MPETVTERRSNDLWDHPTLNPWALEAIAARGYDDYGLGIVDPLPDDHPQDLPDHEPSGRSPRSEASARAAIADAMGDEPYDPEAIRWESDPEYVALVQTRAERGQHRPVAEHRAERDDLADLDAQMTVEQPSVSTVIAQAREQASPGRAERERKDRRNARDRARRDRRWKEREAAGSRPRGFRPRP